MHCTSDAKRTDRTTSALVPERLRHEKEAISPASAADTLAAAHAIDPHTPWSTRRIRFIWAADKAPSGQCGIEPSLFR